MANSWIEKASYILENVSMWLSYPVCWNAKTNKQKTKPAHKKKTPHPKTTVKSLSDINVSAIIIHIMSLTGSSHCIWIWSFHWLQQWWTVSKKIQLYVAMRCDKGSVFFSQWLFYLQSWFLLLLEQEGNVFHRLYQEMASLIIKTVLQYTVQGFNLECDYQCLLAVVMVSCAA